MGTRQRARRRRRQLIGDLPEDRREQCLSAARRSRRRALDRVAAELPRQVIHGDLTADNVMRDRRGRHWVIDLGDVATCVARRRTGDACSPTSWAAPDDLSIVGQAVGGVQCVGAPHRCRVRLSGPWSCCAARCSPSAVGASCASIRAATTRVSASSTVAGVPRRVPLDRGDGAAAPGGRPPAPPWPRHPLLAEMDAAVAVDLGTRAAPARPHRPLDRSGHRAAPRARSPAPALRSPRCATASRLSRVSTDTTRPAPTRARFVELYTKARRLGRTVPRRAFEVDTDAGAVEPARRRSHPAR
ncbi:MAG: phosphotransferase [Microbacterium sp.]